MADRLLFIHPSDELYGADRMLLEVLDALPDASRAEVWLPTDLEHVAAALCVELDRRGIANRHVDLPILRRAYRTPATLGALARRCVRLRRELRAARSGVVYCTTSAALLAAPIARASGVRRVICHLQEIWSGGDRKLLAPLAHSCDTLIAISEAVADATGSRLRPRTVVVPNATPEPAGVTPLAGRSGPLTYVVASRWNGWKGHRTLLKAWDALDEPGRLVILGGPPGSGESVDVPALVATLRKPESVVVVGEVADPSAHLDAADVVVVPSDRPEPFGLVAIEAFARGRPVIGSAAGGLLEIVRPDADGWLFPPGDADALATLLQRLDRRRVTAAGRQARQRYETAFSKQAYARRWSSAVSLAEPAPATEAR